MEGSGLREPSPAAEVTQLSLQSEGIWKAVGGTGLASLFTARIEALPGNRTERCLCTQASSK